ncbi:MAG: NAD-dependent epimerase/dehydratase family protein [Bacteroidota bacterium]
MKNSYRIAISCIGSGVGQSVINSLKNANLSFFTLGLGTNPYAFGAYECDAYDYTKSIYEEGFIDELIEKCKAYKIDLVVPGLDDEALLYAQNLDKFKAAGIKTIVSDAALIELCRDKEKMSEVLNPIVDIFVKSYKKETLKEDIKNGKVDFPFIAKPRGGFASRGIEIIRDENDLQNIKDYHIVQELAVPLKTDPYFEYFQKQIQKNSNPQVAEISIQLVYGENQNLIGKMASYNKLHNGIPIEILPYDHPEMWKVIDQLSIELLKLGLRGPINIQGRMTEKGLKLFEMNPRFTGITGLRSLMGFNEVEACVKEFLEIDKGQNQIRFNELKFGMRQTADKAVLIENNNKISEQFSQLHPNQKKAIKPVLLVTGASGFLGKELIKSLKKENKFEVWLLGRNKQKLKDVFDKTFICFDYDDFQNDRIHLGYVDTLVHLGFARPHKSNLEIAQSVALSNQLFTKTSLHHIPYIINISSQSVYGNSSKQPWTESSPINPQTTYAQAKFAVETFLENMNQVNLHGKYTSLRLSTLVGTDKQNIDFVSKMIESVHKNQPLQVYGGNQVLQRMDVKDTAEAIYQVILQRKSINRKAYNLGAVEKPSVLELAKLIKDGFERINFKNQIEIEQVRTDKTYPSIVMDSNLFYKTFDWKPVTPIEDSIKGMIEKSINNYL